MNEIKYMKLTMGEKMTMLRKQEGKTIKEVAAHLKINMTIYIKMENDFFYPSDQQITRLGKLYGLTYEQVIATGEG